MISLEQLVAGITQADSYAQELQIASDLGLPTTAWQPVQAVVSILNVNATVISNFSGTISNMAQGGYASLAAQMVDSSGAPVTAWLDLRSLDVYNNRRQGATFASGGVPLQNTGIVGTAYGPTNPLHAQNQTTGATYTSQGSGTVAASATTVVQFQADKTGQFSTSGIGVTLVLTTPLAGVTCLALTTSLVGSDAESNAALLLRDQNKLGSLGNAGPSQVYDYVARSIPQGSPSASPPYAVSAPITRTAVWLDVFSGDLNVYVANAAGAPGGTDLNVVNAAIQALADPDGQTVNVLPVTTVPIALTGTLYIRSTTGVLTADAITNAEDALANYAQTVPIGGITTAQPNIVPLTEILEALSAANPGTVDVELSIPTANPSLGQSGVPSFTPVSLSVVFV